jgi:cyclopropane-fatty-acyl-phospholipid synthase
MSSKQTDVELEFDDMDFDATDIRKIDKKSRPNGNQQGFFSNELLQQTPRNAPAPVHGRARSWQRALVRRLLNALGDPAVSVQLWDGERITTTGRDPVGVITLTSPDVLRRLVLHQDIGFGECYSAGALLIDGDLVEVLIALEIARERVAKQTRLMTSLPKLVKRRPRINTLEGSKANIHHHYDIGNEFYELWLDDQMQYTCAYFARQDYSLEQAQNAKMEHVCRKLELKPGQSVVEAGCGWGGLARYMATHYDVTVKAYNISHEQVKYARERAKSDGLADRIEYIEDDYRAITGQFDVFVSVGMLEHVGTANYGALGAVIDGSLKENGRGLIHTIGRNRPMEMNAWIEKRIFPGAYPPTLREMMDIFESGNFSVFDVENLRLHYATTLRHWLQRFENHQQTIGEQFDAEFIRAWRLYLSGSITAFVTSYLQLFQVSFARGEDNSVAWTREHLYDSMPVSGERVVTTLPAQASPTPDVARRSPGDVPSDQPQTPPPATRKQRSQGKRSAAKRDQDDRQMSF